MPYWAAQAGAFFTPRRGSFCHRRLGAVVAVASGVLRRHVDDRPLFARWSSS
jgi:hypothetical protein